MRNAEDLMTKRFLRISTDHTLGEMLSIVLYGEQKKHDTGAIVLIDAEAEFAGILTHNTLSKALSPSASADSAPYQSSESFFNATDQRFSMNVADFVSRSDSPSANKETSLIELALIASEAACDCIPVIEDGRVEGLVYLTDIFAAIAELALTPESEGIDLK